MALHISNLKLKSFRNYDDFSLDGIGDLTLFIGRNAIGKTNLLEAINLAATGHSFRGAHAKEMISEGSSSAFVGMTAEDEKRLLEIELLLEEGKKSYKVNGKGKALSKVRGIIPCVSFTPDDLEIAKKASSVKRSALDRLGAQLSGNYQVVLSDYEKTLRYKNRLLKEEASSSLVEAIDDTLITCGSQLMSFRLNIFKRIIPLVAQHYAEITSSSEPFSAAYAFSWEDELDVQGKGDTSAASIEAADMEKKEIERKLREAIEGMAQEERSRKRSLIGPHRDKIIFNLSGRDASSFASQGQQRSIVLAWKMAEADMVRLVMGVEPVLLLDDVMSELDSLRRKELISLVKGDIQTFMTATDLSAFDEDVLSRAQVIRLGA